jgi:hypothetical protein
MAAALAPARAPQCPSCSRILAAPPAGLPRQPQRRATQRAQQQRRAPPPCRAVAHDLVGGGVARRGSGAGRPQPLAWGEGTGASPPAAPAGPRAPAAHAAPARNPRPQTATLLEQVTSFALRARLKECRAVHAEISCDAFSLLAGRVNSVTIRGEGWRSPLDLTAQLLEVRAGGRAGGRRAGGRAPPAWQLRGAALAVSHPPGLCPPPPSGARGPRAPPPPAPPRQATVGAAALDYAQVLLRRQIVLTNVPTGTARVVFSEADLGNFLVHPLVKAAAKTAVKVGRRGLGHVCGSRGGGAGARHQPQRAGAFYLTPPAPPPRAYPRAPRRAASLCLTASRCG